MTPPQHTPPSRLKDKRIFLVGNREDTAFLYRKLRENGATVIYPAASAVQTYGLTPAQAEKIAGEIMAASPLPDLVVVYRPVMQLTPTELAGDPTMTLAAAIRDKKIPVLALDTADKDLLSENTRQQMRQCGINNYDSIDESSPDEEALASIERMFNRRGRGGQGGTGGHPPKTSRF